MKRGGIVVECRSRSVAMDRFGDRIYIGSSGGYYTPLQVENLLNPYLGSWENFFLYRFTHDTQYTRAYPAAPTYAGQTFCSTARGYGRFNDCINAISYQRGAACNSYVNWKNSKADYIVGFRCAWPSDFTPFHISPAQIVRIEDYPLLPGRASFALRPKFQSDFNAFVALCELKDFRDLAKYITPGFKEEIASKVKSIRRRIRGYSKESVLQRTGGTFKDGTLTAAKFWLTKSFLVDPIIKDFHDLMVAVKNKADKAQDQFIEDGLKPSREHFGYEVLNEESSTLDYSCFYNAFYKTTYNRINYNMTVERTYDYVRSTPMRNFMKYYGFAPSASGVWELIPFSFVVDYFVSIGSWLEDASWDPDVVNLKHTQCCHSLLSTSGKEIKRIGSGSASSITEYPHYSAGPAAVLCYIQSSYYVRKSTVWHPAPFFPSVNSPGDKQWKNLAALARVLW